jgi:hypothetical protein
MLSITNLGNDEKNVHYIMRYKGAYEDVDGLLRFGLNDFTHMNSHFA